MLQSSPQCVFLKGSEENFTNAEPLLLHRFKHCGGTLWRPYCSAAAIVVKVHKRSSISDRPFPGVYEGFSELDAIVDIIAAAAPVELPPVVLEPPTFVRVAVAVLELPLAAGPRERINDSRRGDGVDKRRFSAA